MTPPYAVIQVTVVVFAFFCLCLVLVFTFSPPAVAAALVRLSFQCLRFVALGRFRSLVERALTFRPSLQSIPLVVRHRGAISWRLMQPRVILNRNPRDIEVRPSTTNPCPLVSITLDIYVVKKKFSIQWKNIFPAQVT